MSSPQAILSKILNYSCVDGPGNRLVLFMQGCNFACPTCHNPHTRGQCNHCGDCIPACHANALSLRDGKIAFDKATCDQCDDCLAACPIHSNPMVEHFSVDEILAIIRRHRSFLNGITVSGGEATMQFKFIVALFKAIKADRELSDLTCFIDSNGHLGTKNWRELLPVTDGVMLDIKAFDDDLHHRLTGQSNQKTLGAARLLNEAGKLYELRFLMIPKHTDSAKELENLSRFATTLAGDVRIKLNAFQLHGVRGASTNWPKMQREDIEAAATQLRAAGVTNVVTPVVYL